MTDKASKQQPGLEPAIIVIFGITGDLAQRKLLPAIYHLFKDDMLHEDSVILGISRRDVTAEVLLSQVELCVNEVDKVCDPVGIAKVKKALQMHQMSQTEEVEYDQLLQLLDTIEDKKGVCMNRLYYLSIPPKMFGTIVGNLGQHGLNAGCQHGGAASRLMVEKPFGYDLESAEALITETNEWFNENQLFRIDHYTAKRTVQDILSFRRSGGHKLDTLWNGKHIASIEITAFEELTIEGRAEFYEDIGALRDFIQNHLLQLLATVTMELPADSTSTSMHAAKRTLLEAVTPVEADDVAGQTVRGQYQGYADEVSNPDSLTETYAELRTTIDNDRWQGVPVTVRTGKAMADKCTEVRLTLRTNTSPDDHTAGGDPETLVFNMQQEDDISLQPGASKSDAAETLQAIIQEFKRTDTSDGLDGYERVLVDAASGDHTVFTTSHEVLAAWRIVDQVVHAWAKTKDHLVVYPKGSSSVE